MHTTLEAFFREAIEDILRRKRSDMMKKKEEKSTIYPSLMCGVVPWRDTGQSQKWTGRSGDSRAIKNGRAGWRCSELYVDFHINYRPLSRFFNKTYLPLL